MFGRKKKKIEALYTSGSKAVGVVLGVQDTGTTVNENPRLRMQFRIEPLDGSASFEAEKKANVPRISIPHPGDRYPVWYDPNDAETWLVSMAKDARGTEFVHEQFGEVADSLTGFGNGGGEGDPTERLQKLQALRDAGTISEFEFEDKKSQILSEI